MLGIIVTLCWRSSEKLRTCEIKYIYIFPKGKDIITKLKSLANVSKEVWRGRQMFLKYSDSITKI